MQIHTLFDKVSPTTGCVAALISKWWEVAPCVCDMDYKGWAVGGLSGRSPEGNWHQPLPLAPYQTWGGLHSGTGAGKIKKDSEKNRNRWNDHDSRPGFDQVCILSVQDTLGGRFDVTQSYVGEMSELHMWSRVLSADDIYSLASCSSHLQGDVLAWSETEVELHGGVARYAFDSCHWRCHM